MAGFRLSASPASRSLNRASSGAATGAGFVGASAAPSGLAPIRSDSATSTIIRMKIPPSSGDPSIALPSSDRAALSRIQSGILAWRRAGASGDRRAAGGAADRRRRSVQLAARQPALPVSRHRDQLAAGGIAREAVGHPHVGRPRRRGQRSLRHRPRDRSLELIERSLKRRPTPELGQQNRDEEGANAKLP